MDEHEKQRIVLRNRIQDLENKLIDLAMERRSLEGQIAGLRLGIDALDCLTKETVTTG